MKICLYPFLFERWKEKKELERMEKVVFCCTSLLQVIIDASMEGLRRVFSLSGSCRFGFTIIYLLARVLTLTPTTQLGQGSIFGYF